MANLKLIDELLEKTEYIYVLGTDGKPQMPTNRKVRVRSLFKSGLAKIVDTVPFTIRLLYENDAVLQPITIAEDPGRTNIGAAVLTQLGDLVFSAVVETRNKSIKKLMSDRKAYRQASRRGERKARQRLAKRHGSMIKAGMIMRKLPQYAAEEQIKIYGQYEAEKMRSRLTVKKSKRSYNTTKRLMPGCVFYYDGQRHVMTGQSSYGRYLRAYNCGTKDFPASKCQVIQFNAGLVFV